MTRRLLLALAVGLSLLPLACGGGSSRGGGFTAAPATTGSTTSGSNVATIESLRLPGAVTAAGITSGDVPVVYAVAHPQGAPVDVEVSFSQDGGATWSIATPASGSVATSGLATAPAPGVEYVFTWASARDVPGFAADVRLRVAIAPGGAGLESPSFAVDNQVLATSPALNRWPYLNMPVAGEMVLAWRTETDSDSVIEWGPTPALGRTAGSPQARTQEHWVTLTGLQPATRYWYRVLAAGLPITPRASFATPPAPGADVRFLVVGDSGMGNPEQFAIADLMAREPADFLLHTGDIVYPAGGFPLAVGEYNRRYFEPYRQIVGRIPAFPVVGNHDLYGLLGQPYKDTFAMPSNGGGLFEELYFSFEWGDTKFIALETNTLFQLLSFGPHVTWLENELRTNRRKWLIVYMHTPLYSCGDHGDNAALQRLLEPLFEQNHVDLVLCGHDHDYERTLPIKQYNQDPAYPGLVHVITGGGGAALRAVHPNARTAVSAVAHHYLRIAIQGDWLTGEAVDIGGQVIDSFRVRDQ